MGISKVSQWIFFCDECGDGEPISTGDDGCFNQKDAKSSMREIGWRIGKRVIIIINIIAINVGMC